MPRPRRQSASEIRIEHRHRLECPGRPNPSGARLPKVKADVLLSFDMPIYEYRCGKCDEVIEKIQKFADPPLKKHEGCGGRLTKLVSQSSFQLKGSGWYVTDYAGKGQKESDGSDKSDKPESGGDKAGNKGSDSPDSGKSGSGDEASPKKTETPSKKNTESKAG